MSLQRDELAARCLVASLGHAHYSREPDVLASDAVECADALLARLRPVAPATRTTGPVGHTTVVDADAPTGTGRPVAPDSGAPLAAPSPAATPAAYVPEQGHVLRHRNGGMVILDKPDPDSLVGAWLAWKMPGDAVIHGDPIPTNSTWWTYVRRATSSERAAAGLPVDEAPAFDEAKEREAAMEAYRAGTDGRIDPDGTNYPTCRDSFRNGWLARARVAAKGGAS